MKRDIDLIRKILLELESQSIEERSSDIHIDGYDDQVISYHIMLLDEAGLVRGIDASSPSDIYWFADRLTWDGYEFLEASKDDKIWKKAIDLVTAKGGGLVFDVLKHVLISLMKDAILTSSL